MKNFIVLLLLALTSSFANASDPSPLQDFCVAMDDANVFVNGKFCKDPKLVKPEDFFSSGLNVPRSTANKLGTNVTLLSVDRIPGLNTLGLSLARIDYAPNGGLIPPHAHPRASEIILVLEGTLYAGFVTSNPNNTLISKILYPGDVFVFPMGLIHFQLNIAKKTRGVAISALSSQNPGTFTIANALFGANPHINPQVLTKAFQLDDRTVEDLQNNFGK